MLLLNCVLCSLLSVLEGTFSLAEAAAVTPVQLPFTYNRTSFLLNGDVYQIRGGQMDPQRIPAPFWRDRLQKARAMGLNTIFSYVFWDQLEPRQGQWNFSGNNDIATYFKEAQEEGLHVVLRPGPYICGEHEFGGFPAWTLNVPGMVVRSRNALFLNASQSYINHIAEQLKPLLITNGGPILMVQVENEYGSYGTDHEYMADLRDMYINAGFNTPLYTTDGSGEKFLIGGPVHGVLAEIDGGNGAPQEALATRDEYVTDMTCLGPVMDGEYYVTWLDLWGYNETYQTYNDPKDINATQSDLRYYLSHGNSFNIYMFHGATNWGFQSGADWANALTPVTTSYDYGAPLDESGASNNIYFAIRSLIQNYTSDTIPEVPANSSMMAVPEIQMSYSASLFDSLPSPAKQNSPDPINMEALDQIHGFILYRHQSTQAMEGSLVVGDYPRDRILIYVNGTRKGIMDAVYTAPFNITMKLQIGDTLDLVVENTGRINYGPRIPDQKKGILGNVTLDGNQLQNWTIYSLPLDDPDNFQNKSSSSVSSADASHPAFYRGTFNSTQNNDTFIVTSGWTKGMVWVNGINLGRYWVTGPQRSLYLPGCWLRNGTNDVTILELEGTNSTTIHGIKSSLWGNMTDPDFLIGRQLTYV